MSTIEHVLPVEARSALPWPRYLLDSLLAFGGVMLVTGILYLFQLYPRIPNISIPQIYRSLLLADLRKVEPEAIGHFIQEKTKIKLPRDGQVPTLIAAGQQEVFDIKHAVYEMRRTLPSAQGVLLPGVGHFWNVEAPDVFTKTL
jgi:pimeloyl-ACP methyl ester carboxylesterase